MGGRDPYSASKGCAELATEAYRRSYFDGSGAPGLASVRAGNVIGGGDWAADRLVPDLLQAFADGRSALVRRPAAVRPWQHVIEPLRGYLMLAQRLCENPASFSTGWNFGPYPADARPVDWIADGLAARWGGSAAWHRDVGQHPHEASALVLDCSKAGTGLGWRPMVDLETALDWVVAWHHELRAGRDARSITLDQIGRFESLCRSAA